MLLTAAPPAINLPIKLICTDFDGTLVGSEEGENGLIPFVEMVSEQRESSQLQWVINTGRGWDTLYMELQDRGFPIMPDWLVLGEREVYRVVNDHPVGDYEWLQKCETVHSTLFSRVTGFWRELTEYINSQTGAEAMADRLSPVTIRARNNYEADRIHLFINSRISSYPGLVMMRNSIFFRFAHEKFHKGTALERVQQHVGVDASQTLVVGDQYNDLPMMDSLYAKYITCPSNAIMEVQDHVQAIGGVVAGLPEASGVVQAWRHYLHLQP